MLKDFIKEVLEDPNTFGGFQVTEYKESTYSKGVWCGKAKDRIGLTLIEWCTRGHSVTYFGEELDANMAVGIKKDAGTRTVFNGYCFNKEDFEKVLNLTW